VKAKRQMMIGRRAVWGLGCVCLAMFTSGPRLIAADRAMPSRKGSSHGPHLAVGGARRLSIRTVQDIVGIGMTSRYKFYTGADTGIQAGRRMGISIRRGQMALWVSWTLQGSSSWSGYSEGDHLSRKIVGDDPMNLKVYHWAPSRLRPCRMVGAIRAAAWFITVSGTTERIASTAASNAWWYLRPFVGFRWSDDYGRTWDRYPLHASE